MSRFMKTAAFAAIIGCLVTALPAQAQNDNCQSLRLILQAKLDISPTGKGWSGEVRGFLGNTSTLLGTLSGIGGLPTVATGQTGHEPEVVFSLDFGTGILITQPATGIYQLVPAISPKWSASYPPPPPLAFGNNYMYTSKIDPARSTGIFANTTGSFSLNGLFLVDAAKPLNDMGVWNAEINGKVCKK